MKLNKSYASEFNSSCGFSLLITAFFDKIWKGILVGYSCISSGNRIYNIEPEKVLFPGDLKVYGDAYWDWNITQLRRICVKLALEDSNEVMKVE